MTKHILIFVAILSGCSNGAPRERLLPQLTEGLTRQEVFELIGPPVEGHGYGKMPNGCDAHIYNELSDAHFIHIYYDNGRLTSATDQHNNVCFIQ